MSLKLKIFLQLSWSDCENSLNQRIVWNCFSAYASFSLNSEEICRLESSLMINFWQFWQIIYALEKNLIPCLLLDEIQYAIKCIPSICYLHAVIWTKYLRIELLGEKVSKSFSENFILDFSGEPMLKFFFTNKTRTILFVSGKIKLKVLQLDWISLILDNFRWRSEICN